jgi:hypothetical protein
MLPKETLRKNEKRQVNARWVKPRERGAGWGEMTEAAVAVAVER